MKSIAFKVLTILCLAGESSADQRTLVWQGFRHKWERSLFSFNTPHRMGSIENQIIEKGSSANGGINADAHFTFTPGVNGDYAHPEVYYTDVQIKDTDNFAITNTTVSFEYTDQIRSDGDYNKHNEANMTKSKVFKIENPQGMDHAEAMINGYNVQMKCVGDSCNSNGIWPFKFNISVVKTANKDEFNLTYTINRGWTPSHGGGKALNQQMHFHVDIPVKIFQFNKNTGAVNHTMMIDEKKITDKPYYFIDVVSFPKDFNGSMAIVGMHAIGFEIEWQPAYADRGRYIEDFEFFIKSISYQKSEQRAFVGYQYALTAPSSTTYKATVHFTQGITAIAVTDTVQVPHGMVKKVSGNVCVDDWTSLFWCSSVKMKAQTHDEVPFTVAAQQKAKPIEFIY